MSEKIKFVFKDETVVLQFKDVISLTGEKVKTSEADSIAGYLLDKIVPGDNIQITQTGDADKKLEIKSTAAGGIKKIVDIILEDKVSSIALVELELTEEKEYTWILEILGSGKTGWKGFEIYGAINKETTPAKTFYSYYQSRYLVSSYYDQFGFGRVSNATISTIKGSFRITKNKVLWESISFTDLNIFPYPARHISQIEIYAAIEVIEIFNTVGETFLPGTRIQIYEVLS